MTPAEVVRARILAISAVTALVGSRVYSVIFPESVTWPAVRVQDIGQVEDLHLRGAVGAIRGRVQVDVISGVRNGVSSLQEAKTVMALIHGDGGGSGNTPSGLNAWSGSVGSPAIQVDLIEPVDYRERFEAEEIKAWMISRDYRAHVRAA